MARRAARARSGGPTAGSRRGRWGRTSPSSSWACCSFYGGRSADVRPVGAHRAARLAADRGRRGAPPTGPAREVRRAGCQSRRVCDLGAAVVGIRAERRHAVHGRSGLDRRVGHSLRRGGGRDLAVPRAPHDVPHAALDPGQLELYHHAGGRLLRAAARPGNRDDRGLCRARSLPLLCDVGSDADPDVLHHRRLGRGQPAVRSHQGAAIPAAHLAARRARRGTDGRIGDSRRHPAEDGDVRLPAIRVAVLPGRRAQSDGAARHRDSVADRDHLRRPRRDGAARLQEADRLLVRRAPRLRDARHLGADVAERAGRAADHDQSRHLDRRAVLPGRHDLRTAAQPADRSVWRHRPGRAAVCGDSHDRIALVDRAAGHERLRRGVPGAARVVPHLSPRDGAGDDGRDRGRRLSADRAAARDLQSAHESREREAHRSDTARDRRAGAAARVHSVGRHLSEAVPAAHGARRAGADRADAAERRGDRGSTVRLDPSVYLDLLLSLLPELVLTGWALVLLLFVAWRHKTVRDLRIAGWLTLLALISTAVATWWLWWNRAGMQGVVTMVAADDFRWVADWVFLGAAALTVLISFAYLEREQLLAPEYYVLLIFGTLGMMVMAAGADLMVIFLGLELMSVAVYVLAGFDRRRARSAEAALKYFLLGAFASGFLLYGIALVYGATGTTNLGLIGGQVSMMGKPSVMLLIGLALLIVGFGFKIAAVPFHMWAPDVYDGAPTPVTAFMATGVKAAAF